MVSLLAGQSGVKTLDMPKSEGADPRPFEVIGIPLTPGFHVLEIASQKLGDALLDERHGAGRTMYVRTTALATNLAVHFKLGRENAHGLGDDARQGQGGGRRHGARVRLQRQGAGQRPSPTPRGIASIGGISPEAPGLCRRRR